MIINIPKPNEFLDTGLEYINISYEAILELIDVLEETGTGKKVDERNFWDDAKKRLLIYTSMAHQGVDFLIKSQIAGVSPFLLLSNHGDKYPKAGEDDDINYSDMFTIDSSKLLDLFRISCSMKLPSNFQNKYEENRKRRNKIVHTVDAQIQLTAEEVLYEIIFLTCPFLPKEDWINSRFNYLSSKAEFGAYGYEDGIPESHILTEIRLLKNRFSNTQFKLMSGVSKQTRLYLCPTCFHPDYNTENQGSAFLSPNKPSSTSITCLICSCSFNVYRKDCESSDCPSNVYIIDQDACGLCLN